MNPIKVTKQDPKSTNKLKPSDKVPYQEKSASKVPQKLKLTVPNTDEVSQKEKQKVQNEYFPKKITSS